MSNEKEQVKPLAPAAHRLPIQIHDHPDAFSVELASYRFRRRQRFIKICGCSAALLLITVTIILVLMFTVFHVKIPVLKMNAVTVKGASELGPGRNLTFDFDFSVKNPNVASFKFSNSTTYVYYEGSMIGETTGPPGSVRARKRMEMEASVGVMVDDIVRVGKLKDGNMMGISSFTRISGRVRVTRTVKESFVLQLNCTMTVNIVRQEIQDLNCT